MDTSSLNNESILLNMNNSTVFRFEEFMNLCNIILLRIVSLCSEIKVSLSEGSRLKFLESTINKIAKFSSGFEKEINDLGAFVYFIERISNYLKDLLNLLERIKKGDSLFTHNFDIFEFKLRESLFELETMFRIEESGKENLKFLRLICPSSVIKSDKVRNFWETTFGNDRYTINFNEFVKMVEIYFLHGNAMSQDTELRLRYLANFPEGARVSPFKLNQLVQMFGEDGFVENLKSIDNKGFLGLINRIEASELLRYTKNNTILIRFSRTEPEYIAFSCKKNGRVYHYINKEKDTRNFIPVDEFIQLKFSGCEVLLANLNYKEVLEMKNLSDYSSNDSGYIC
jgi:hypothetical protein